MSSAYHPQTDGQTKVLNRSLEQYLRCFTFEQPKVWIKWLYWAKYWYNTSYQNAIKQTPSQALYGRALLAMLQYLPGETRIEEVSTTLMDRDEIIRQLRHHILNAQNSMSQYANKKRREVEYQVGDMVFLKI